MPILYTNIIFIIMLNISKQIYSGWDTTNIKHDLPEAEVIPYGTAANEKKKLEKITKQYTILKEFDNIPLPGFTLYKTGRKNWGSADQTWLVIDPRGFLVRITNVNLEEILHVTGITEGLIQEKCVWARENSQTKMTLVPVTSPDYIEATKNTELIESRVNIKDVQIGDKVILQNKLSGTYMGVLSLYASLSEYRLKSKAQTFLRRQVVKIENGKYFYQTDAKILKVIEHTETPITKEKSAELINKEIELGNCYFSNSEFQLGNINYYFSRGTVKLVSGHAVPKVPISLEEISFEDAEELFNVAVLTSDSGMLLVENKEGNQFFIDYPVSFSGNKITKNSFNVYRIDTINDMDDEIILAENPYQYGVKKISYSLDNFVKFYKIVKHVKNESYI